MGIAAISLVVLLLGSACGGGDDAESTGAPDRNDTGTESPSPSEQENDTGGSDDTDKKRAIQRAKVVDTAFEPAELTIAAGTAVAWQQTGRQAHSVTSSDGDFDSSPGCGALDPEGCLGEGDSFRHEFEEPGTYEYYCRVHGLPDGTGMTATVIVEG